MYVDDGDSDAWLVITLETSEIESEAVDETVQLLLLLPDDVKEMDFVGNTVPLPLPEDDFVAEGVKVALLLLLLDTVPVLVTVNLALSLLVIVVVTDTD